MSSSSATKKTTVHVVRTTHKPLYERWQDWVYEMEGGRGGGLFRVGMFFILVLLVIVVYTGTQFYGLRDAEAMNYGQLARNIARGEGYVTRVVRPMAIGHYKALGAPPLHPQTATQPELFTPPGYPYFLAAIFKVVRPNFDIGPGVRTVRADRLLMIIGWASFLAALILTYLLAREMFDHRVAVLSCFLFLFCDGLLDAAASGLELNWLGLLFLVSAFGVIKAEKWVSDQRHPVWSYTALAISALAVAVASLTRYPLAVLILPLAVYVGISFPRDRWLRMGLVVLIFALVWTPWLVRNWKVSRTWFGLGQYTLYEGTGRNTPSEIAPGQLQRTLTPELPRRPLVVLVRQGLLNLHTVYRETVKDVGANYVIAFFLVSLLHRWRRDEVYRLRRYVFWSLLFLVVALCIGGGTGGPRNLLIVLMPVMVVYAAAFFYVLFERLQLRTRLVRAAMVGGFVFLNALPVIYTVLPPATTLPYPPFDGGVCAAVGRLFREDVLLASDIPWAVAWYGDRSCVWIPTNEKDYLLINDGVRFIAAVYLTQATYQQMTALELMRGKNPFLMRLYQPPPPPNFPLRHIEAVTPDGQQVLLSNRVVPGATR